MKHFNKILLAGFLAISTLSVEATNLYRMATPDFESRKYIKSLCDDVTNFAADLDDTIRYEKEDWHMTLQGCQSPIRGRDLRNGIPGSWDYIKNALKPQTTRTAKYLSNITFSIKDVEVYGRQDGDRQFIVLTLEPNLDHIEDKAVKRELRRQIIAQGPHISLGRFQMSNGVSRNALHVIVKRLQYHLKIEDSLHDLRFNKVRVQADHHTTLISSCA